MPTDLEEAELSALLAAADPRQRLFFLLCARVGLRCFEACALRHEDIEWREDEACYLRVLGKGGKEALLPLSRSVRVALRDWTRPGLIGWLFPARQEGQPGRPGNDEGHISRRAAQYWMRTACERAAIPQRKAHIHALRHSFATHLLRRGVTLKEVQELMRHSNISTTSVYLHTTPERLQEAVDRLDRAS